MPEEVGPARDDQRDQRPDLGADQSLLLASASETKVETGTLLRLDSTVTATLLHPW